MKKFRTRLALVLIVMIGLAMLVAGLLSAMLLRNSHIDALETNMRREISLLLATDDWRRTGSEDEMIRYYSEKVRYYKDSADARITFVRSDGKVLGDSETDPAGMDNHLQRKEIQQAMRQPSGQSIRHSDTLNQNMLYVAEAVKDGAGQTVGFIRLAMSLQSVDASIRRLLLYLLTGLGVLFIAAILASYRTARYLTRPLEKITRVAQQITDLNYQSRVDVRSRDEIGQLGQAINSMADSLQLQLKRISENESRLTSVLDNMMSGVLMIGRDERFVLMNRSAEEFLGFTAEELLGKHYAVANQQLEFSGMIRECLETLEPSREEIVFYFPEERILEVNLSPLFDAEGSQAGILIVLHNITAIRRLERMRSEFVANVSHELKTPIAAVKGFSETLLAGALDDKETARTFLQIIFDESERLNRLIGDILDLSKIESKRIPMQFSPVELKPFIETSIHMMDAAAEKKHIELSMEVEDDLYIEADEDRLRQIVINLLSNGISYTPDNGKVKVTVEPIPPPDGGEYERIRLTISDTGTGIPKKDLPRIFERFYRVDKARSRSSGGTGLGLSIVKHLVELHSGTITVESTVGMGSRFIIELPVLHEHSGLPFV